jgi:hypothetical protein
MHLDMKYSNGGRARATICLRAGFLVSRPAAGLTALLHARSVSLSQPPGVSALHSTIKFTSPWNEARFRPAREPDTHLAQTLVPGLNCTMGIRTTDASMEIICI